MMLNRQSVRLVDTSQLMKRYSRRQSELQRRQRKYRKDLETPSYLDRNQILHMESYKDLVEKQKYEKDILKAKIWTATGKSHITKNSQALTTIQCLINCYIALTDEVQHSKIALTNLTQELSNIDKEVYNLKMNVQRRNQENFENAKKRLQNLEDRYEDMVKIECKLCFQSEKLRSTITELLDERTLYSTLYTKYIQKLNEGKKYLTDLLDYALRQIEMVINTYEKMEQNTKKYIKELERRKVEMNDIQRQQLSHEMTSDFNAIKSEPRPLAPVAQKQKKRAEQIRNKYLRKVNLYNDVLEKIREYTGSYDIKSVIVNFQEQESLYYSYFNYANEISYRITLLNNSVAHLFKEIQILKLSNRDKQRNQIEFIDNLKVILEERRKNNEKLRKTAASQDERIGKLFEALTLIRDQSRTDAATMLNAKFIDHQDINLVNMREQMKLIEKRIYSIVAATYWLERRNKYQTYPSTYLVKGLDKRIEYTTAIDEIVLATQCSECAEVDLKNLDNDDGQNAYITPLSVTKQIIADKVIQPDMQYRLHDINHCRLPRSRFLWAQRQSI